MYAYRVLWSENPVNGDSPYSRVRIFYDFDQFLDFLDYLSTFTVSGLVTNIFVDSFEYSTDEV